MMNSHWWMANPLKLFKPKASLDFVGSEFHKSVLWCVKEHLPLVCPESPFSLLHWTLLSCSIDWERDKHCIPTRHLALKDHIPAFTLGSQFPLPFRAPLQVLCFATSKCATSPSSGWVSCCFIHLLAALLSRNIFCNCMIPTAGLRQLSMDFFSICSVSPLPYTNNPTASWPGVPAWEHCIYLKGCGGNIKNQSLDAVGGAEKGRFSQVCTS